MQVLVLSRGYKVQVESNRVAIRGVETRGESVNTTIPTQLNPRQHEPLDGRIGSIHNSQWSSLAELYGGSQFLGNSTLVGATSYAQSVEVAPYMGKNQFFNMCL